MFLYNAMGTIVDYFSPASQQLPPLDRSNLSIAMWCGGSPLVAGIATFLLWLATRASALEVVGLIVIMFGLMLFAIGSIALLVHVGTNWRRLCGGEHRSR